MNLKLFIFILFFNYSYSFSLPKKITHCGIEHCDVDNIDACTGLCHMCLGKGSVLCGFCHGTGFLTIGDQLIGTNNNCSACNGIGEMECKKCMGSGRIANWRTKFS